MFPSISGRWLALVILALLWAAASCGGSASSPGPGAPGGDSRILPLGSPVPALPDGVRGRETPNTAGSRSASALQSYNGADFIAAAGATIDGTSVILESTEGEVAWAMYKAEGLQGKDVAHYAIETVPDGLNTYSVGISNFTDDRWEYYITTNLPEVDVDLTEETRRLISILGNLYWIVVVSDGASVRVDTAYLDIVEGNDDVPAIPQGLSASTDLPDGVSLWWLPSDGATSYGIYRRNANSNDEFTQIGSTIDTYYYDYEVDPLGAYEYRVNASNSHGTSDFSDIAYGAVGKAPRYEFAYGPIESLDEGSITVEGKTFAHDEFTYWFDEFGYPVQWSDFKEGDEVYVDGFFDDNDNLIAYYVASAEDWYWQYWDYASGPIEAIDASSVTIGGNTFTFTEFTYISDEFGNPVTWDFFAVGDSAYVSGYYDEDGNLLADYLSPWDQFWAQSVEGYVEAVDASSITVSGITVNHSPVTVFVDENGIEVTWAEIEVGDYAFVEYETGEDGSLNATYVSVYVGSGHVIYTGYITGLTEGTLQLDTEFNYTHDGETLWSLYDGTEAVWSDFELNDYVTVESVSDDQMPGGYALYVYLTMPRE